MTFQIGTMSIQSTAGAIAIRNDKDEISMEKVKVQRYVTGKRYAFTFLPQSRAYNNKLHFWIISKKKVESVISNSEIQHKPYWIHIWI